ncbi:MAG: NAD(P)/FAD-dependent oxidoreductase [Rhizobiales bacterium]|nr:NAD(P)/FAD-dependent oxidoreductase [Hyphomicrobiales bacterium]
MLTKTEPVKSSKLTVEHFDVLIVGAGISGIDAAYHLQQNCPGKSFALLDRQAAFGGTWRLHKFPGIRSDSDLFTFGYKWKPWTGVPIATADEILKYLDEAIDEQNLRQHITYRQQVENAVWSTQEARWTLTVLDLETEDRWQVTCSFLWMCQGYYKQTGYVPEYPGVDRFEGPVVHPQNWPDDLDHKDKNVVVIGSGATAATLIPAMAEDTAHVTMLQRSPTFFYPRPKIDELAEQLRTLDVPEEWTHEILRRKYLFESEAVTRRSFEEPEVLKAELLEGARTFLGEDFDIDTHFTPSYRPWRQRIALIPDGDLFQAIRDGKASVVTDEIETFVESGIKLKSGETLDADIIVSATGFDLCVLGDIAFEIDGAALKFEECWAHRGILFSGVPNLAWVFGYLRSSWTLRADLVSGFVCRLLNHMEEQGAAIVTPGLREEDRDMPEIPFVDPENFNAGYLMRSMHKMPKQGDRQPWIFSQDYYKEKDEIPAADLEDGTLVYT